MIQRVMAGILAIVIGLQLGGCGQKAMAPIVEVNTYHENLSGPFSRNFTLSANCSSQEEFDYMLSVLNARLRYLAEIFSTTQDGTVANSLKAVNDNAGIEPVELPVASVELLRQTKLYASEVGSSIRVTGGRITRHWRDWLYSAIGNIEPPHPPSLDELQKLGSFVNDEKLTIGGNSHTVYLAAKGMELDMEGHTLAYAMDDSVNYLRRLGFDSFQLKSGGFQKAVGEPFGPETCWHFTLPDPTPDKRLSGMNGQLDVLCLENQAVAMVGSHEYFFEEQGERYHSLVSMDSLQPENHYLAVVAIDENSILRAEILAKGLFLLPIEDSKHLAQLSDQTQVMWVHYDGRIEVTDGFTELMRRRGQKIHNVAEEAQ